MRRIIASLVAVLGLVVGLLGTAAPAEAHTPWPTFERDVCNFVAQYWGYDGWSWDSDDSFIAHYGSTHIVYCAVRHPTYRASVCFQHLYEPNITQAWHTAAPNECW